MTPDTNSENKPQTITLQYTPGAQDWNDTGENANYMNRCSLCRRMFMGHKHRVVCRTCTEKAAKENDIPSCRICNTPMQRGQAIPPAFVTMDEGTISEGHHVGSAPLADVWKCPKCGHSFQPAPCKIEEASSRMCELGTKSCTVQHSSEPAQNAQPMTMILPEGCGINTSPPTGNMAEYPSPAPTDKSTVIAIGGFKHFADPPPAQAEPETVMLAVGDRVTYKDQNGTIVAEPVGDRILVRYDGYEHDVSERLRDLKPVSKAEPTAQTAGEAAYEAYRRHFESQAGSSLEPWGMLFTGTHELWERAAQAAIAFASQQEETPADDVTQSIEEWIKSWPPITEETLKTLRDANEKLNNDPWFQVDVLRSIVETRDMHIKELEQKLSAFAQSSRIEQARNVEMPSIEKLTDIGMAAYRTKGNFKDQITALVSAVREACMRGDNLALQKFNEYREGWKQRAESAEQKAKAHKDELKRMHDIVRDKDKTIADLRKENAEWKFKYDEQTKGIESLDAEITAERQIVADLRRENEELGLKLHNVKFEKEQAINREAEAIGALTRMEESNKTNYATYDEAMKRLESDLTAARETLRKAEEEKSNWMKRLSEAQDELASLKASSGWVAVSASNLSRESFESVLYCGNKGPYDFGIAAERDVPSTATHVLRFKPLPTPPPSPEEGERKVITVHDPIPDELLETACVILSRWLHEHPELSELVLKRTMAKGLADVAAEAATVP